MGYDMSGLGSVSINRIAPKQKEESLKTLTVETVHRLIGVSTQEFNECMEVNFRLSEYNVPVRPDESVILEWMYKIPSNLDFVNGLLVEVEIMKKDHLLMLSKKEDELELERAKKRISVYQEYENKVSQYPEETKKFIQDFKMNVLEGKMTSSIAERLLMQKTPQKPTVNIMDDLSRVEDKEKREEVYRIKETLNDYDELYKRLERVQQKFITLNFTIKKDVDYLIAEMRNGKNF
ncbi:hypothetical protein [Bacillus bombysepticus]|uniref:hypothetical protein n=1 Tax=Bacillus bombysepticus TaxID=658666 RepID=UPI00301A96B2